MDQHVPPRRADRSGSTNRTRKNRNLAESVTDSEVKRKRKPARPLGLLGNALDQAQWDRLRWDVEAEGGL